MNVVNITQVREWTTVCFHGGISTPLNMMQHETECDWFLYLSYQSYGLLCGSWPFKAAMVPRPSVWLCETKDKQTSDPCWGPVDQ